MIIRAQVSENGQRQINTAIAKLARLQTFQIITTNQPHFVLLTARDLNRK
jgi:hypothetical protein